MGPAVLVGLPAAVLGQEVLTGEVIGEGCCQDLGHIVGRQIQLGCLGSWSRVAGSWGAGQRRLVLTKPPPLTPSSHAQLGF